MADNDIKKEDARFVIPVGACTNVMVTLADIGLLNFLEQRTNPNTAQWEINDIADKLEGVLTGEIKEDNES